MKCPYVFGKQTETHTRCSNADTETGIYNKEQTIVIISAQMPDCLEKECAVWRDGKCCYNG